MYICIYVNKKIMSIKLRFNYVILTHTHTILKYKIEFLYLILFPLYFLSLKLIEQNFSSKTRSAFSYLYKLNGV